MLFGTTDITADKAPSNEYNQDKIFHDNLNKIKDILDQANSQYGEKDIDSKISRIFDRSFLNFLSKENKENKGIIHSIYNKAKLLLRDSETKIDPMDRIALEELVTFLKPYYGYQKNNIDAKYTEEGKKEKYNENSKFIAEAKNKINTLENIPEDKKSQIMLFLKNPTKGNIQNLQKFILEKSKGLQNFDRIDFYRRSFDKNFQGKESVINWNKTPDGKFGVGSLKGFNSFVDSYDEYFKKVNESAEEAKLLAISKNKKESPELYTELKTKEIDSKIEDKLMVSQKKNSDQKKPTLDISNLTQKTDSKTTEQGKKRIEEKKDTEVTSITTEKVRDIATITPIKSKEIINIDYPKVTNDLDVASIKRSGEASLEKANKLSREQDKENFSNLKEIEKKDIIIDRKKAESDTRKDTLAKVDFEKSNKLAEEAEKQERDFNYLEEGQPIIKPVISNSKGDSIHTGLKIEKNLDQKIKDISYNYDPKIGIDTSRFKSTIQPIKILERPKPKYVMENYVFDAKKDFARNKLLYIDKVKDNQEEFGKKVVGIGKALEFNPNRLMETMNAESALQHNIINKTEKNIKKRTFGLIQFKPDTIKGLVNTYNNRNNNINSTITTEEFRSLSNIEQLDFVKIYLETFKGKIKSPVDLHLIAFRPAALGKPDNYIFERKEIRKIYNKEKGKYEEKEIPIVKNSYIAKVNGLVFNPETQQYEVKNGNNKKYKEYPKDKPFTLGDFRRIKRENRTKKHNKAERNDKQQELLAEK